MRALLGFVACLLLCCVFAAVAHAAPAVQLPDIPVAVEWLTGWTGHADGLAVASAGVAAPFSFFGRRSLEPAFEEAGDKGGNPPSEKQLSRQEVEAIVEGRLKQNGGTTDAATIRLFADEAEKLAEARRQLADVQREITKVKPPDGAVVLSGAEAEAFTKLKGREGYGDTPLAKALADLEDSATKLTEAAQRDRKASQDEAFRAAGLDPAKVRKYLPQLDARLEGEGDKAKAVAVIKGENGAESTKDLAELLKEPDYAEILPVLSGDATQQARRGGEALPQRSAAAGTGGKATDEDIRKGQRKAGLNVRL